MNHIEISGHLADDPKVTYTNENVVCNLTLAVNRIFTKKDSEKKADFFRVSIWGKQAELAGNTLTKGKKILVEGSLQINSYVTHNNEKRWVTEIIAHHFEYMFSKPTSDDTTDFLNLGDSIPFEDIKF